VNGFVSKLNILKVWICIPDLTFFFSTFQQLFEVLGHSSYGHWWTKIFQNAFETHKTRCYQR